MNSNIVKLPYSFISIIGDDAVKFLQGQCSVDLDSLSNENFTYGTLNTPKGRMYALFKVTLTDRGLLLCLHKSTADKALQTLSKYAVFFKCSLEKAEYYAYGCEAEHKSWLINISSQFASLINGELTTNKAGNDESVLLKLPGNQALFELWVNRDLPDTNNQVDTQNKWQAKETLCGIPQVFEETVEQFILQELNLQELGAVSFKKGCYTGQEIIARMKFLGKLKKRMYLLHATSELPLNTLPGSDVYVQTEPDENRKSGKLVRAHRLDEKNLVALAVLKKEHVTDSSSAIIDQQSQIKFSIQDIRYDDS